MIPLLYVLAKNMEVDLQNKDLKQEIFALCQKLGKLHNTLSAVDSCELKSLHAYRYTG